MPVRVLLDFTGFGWEIIISSIIAAGHGGIYTDKTTSR
ncbi:unnamed protein product [Arabidopsis thaliana]|uniref:(thale cress) hypothetical protein n=1 Tax=Arabidopsis thaliana TaxID=3702 RepID=A0A7G2DUG8_ARATH|nr:unnamed protein product [Arabidopsis thaliana]